MIIEIALWYSVHPKIDAQELDTYSDSVFYVKWVQFWINIHLTCWTFRQQFEILTNICGCLTLKDILNDLKKQAFAIVVDSMLRLFLFPNM